MASTYTDIGTELMTTGENAGNWGTKTNTNLQILEEAIRGYVAVSIAGGAQTTALTYTDGTVGDNARNAVIALTGTITGNQVVTVTAKEKWWIIDNQTSGAYTVQILVSGQTGVTWGASDKGTKILYCNGTDVVDTNIGGVGAYDLNGAELTLDADADTSITASTDDQIDFEIAGADDFTMTANAFNVLTGSHVTFADSANAKFGTSNDMLMYHDGSNSYITNAVGALKIATETSGIAVTIGHTTSETTIADNLTVTGTLTGTLATAAQGTVTSLGTLTTLTVDNVITNGTTIGHTDDTDLMTLADGVLTVAGELDATTLDISGNADIDGTTNLDAVDIDGAVQIDNTVTVGVNDTGYDVKFFGATSGAYMLWDESTDDLVLAGAAKLYLYDAGGGEYLSSSGSALTLSSGGTAWELPAADGSDGQLLKTDGSGNLDWTTVSGTITALNNQSANRLTTIGSTTTELDGEANLSFTGSALTCIGTVTVGVNDTGHDVKFFGATSGAYMLWDESTDDLVLAGASKLYLYDAAGGEHISSDGTDLTLAAGADLNLTATTDINVPSGVGMTFGNDGEKIEGDGTDLTIAGNNINLTAVADVVIPANVGITFGSGEKIEGDSTDLTVTSGGALNLTATTDVVIPANVGITFGSGEKIEGDSTDLTITSGAKINLTATSDIVVPANVGITFGSGEKIEGDSTDLTITSGADIALTATADVNLPNDVGMVFGDDGEKIEGDGTDLTILSSGVIKFAAGGTTNQITLADGALKPVTDNDVDLGTASLEFKNVYVDGTTYTDALGFGTVVMTLPTADGSANQILTTDGSGTLAFVDNSGGTDWQAIKTGNFTASAGQGVFANTTSSAFTVTLPSSPSLGDEVSIIDYAGTFDTNNLTVGRNSQPIMGEAADLTVAVERSAFTLVYVDSTQGWLLKDK